MSEALSRLVRVVTPPDPTLPIYARHPHEGMVICLDHLKQLDCDPTVEDLSPGQVICLGYCCLMCGVHAVVGKLCENEDCRRPLHPQWPAVYCCNSCAMEDV